MSAILCWSEPWLAAQGLTTLLGSAMGQDLPSNRTKGKIGNPANETHSHACAETLSRGRVPNLGSSLSSTKAARVPFIVLVLLALAPQTGIHPSTYKSVHPSTCPRVSPSTHSEAVAEIWK